MKNIRRVIPWLILIVQTAILIYVAVGFDVRYVTLHKGEIVSFNDGWVIVREDGSSSNITLPYYEDCKADAVIRVKNTIPEKYWGKTLSFITADKEMLIYIDGELVYEFGASDKRDFGSTPGSETNFVDIPSYLRNGEIEIVLKSPYENFSASIDSMTIADRDISILHMFNRSLIGFGCAIVMFLASIIFCVLAWGQRWMKQDSEGIEYLAVYGFISFFFYCIGTKSMSLFYGNQTFYSVAVFLILMSMPIFMLAYFIKRFELENRKSIDVVFVLSIVNACVQIILQIFNIVDFMNMALFSHMLIFTSIIMLIVNLIKISRKNKSIRYKMDIVALSALGISGVADIIRNYTIKAEHIEKYSCYGATIFFVIMLITHILGIIRRYVSVIEENAELSRQKMEMAEKKNEAKTVFLTRMSHEIRTPINAVLGMNKMIINESNEEQIKEYAEDVESAAQALLGIVNEILDMSKIEAGKMNLVEGKYDTSGMIYDVSNMIAVRAQTKDLDFVVKVDEDTPSTLYGDDMKIRQVLVNLLSNAVKYTNEGRVELTVRCHKCEDERNVYITFCVKDTGIGIKKEDMPKLFGEFERIEEERNKNVEGTGLGMSITKQFLKLMDSKIEVESEYGKGSTFSFKIKQEIIDSTPVGDFSEKFAQRRKKYKQEEKAQPTGKKVLLVDDNNINRRIFAALLKNTGIGVVEASSGNECINRVKEEKYDIIFLDHMMPDMDGIETLENMKKLHNNMNESTPVIALTANAIVGAKEFYLNIGFDGYLSKPIIREELKLIIEQYT